ncbi:MAG: NAD(P)H-dependent oxidoreductase [Fibrobacteraceae bacterium]|nr:NAD(P)H-dependent oxidoreductase [Fibrobacteraceae bacterium]
MIKSILALISHPDIANSVFSKYLQKTSKKVSFFYPHPLDNEILWVGGKPSFDFEKEKALLQNAAALVWQFPIYWYNCPPSLRLWQDQILSPIVYGPHNFLKGKKVQVVFTAGARESEYSAQGLNRYTVEEMLRPFEMTANASGLLWQKPLGFFECGGQPSEDKLTAMGDQYLAALEKLME